MPLWFLRGLRRGVVTTRYPARPDPSAAELPSPPAFRPEALTTQTGGRAGGGLPEPGAGPRRLHAGLRRGRVHRMRPLPGRGAGGGAASGEFELAATDRARLVKRIPLLGGGAVTTRRPADGEAPG